jgi:hypothetical protein
VARAPDEAPVDPAIAAYVGAAADMLGLRIRAEHRDEVERQFARLAVLALLLEEHALEFIDEPAPVFHPGPRP